MMKRLHKLCVLSLLLMALPAMAEKLAIVDEYRLKAALIYNFTQYIDWPDSAFAESGSPFVICVAGNDPFGAAFAGIQNQKYKKRPIDLKYPKTVAEARYCHILYVENPHATMLDHDAMKVLGDAAVLTVSSSEDAMESGVGIGFVSMGGKIRWTLNLNAVRKARLKVSVKLIEIAIDIVGEAK